MKHVIKPLRTAGDYDAAQRRAADLLLQDPPLGSPASDELDVLGTLISVYDREHFPIGPADPIAAIAFAMDQRGLEPKDMVPYLGTRSRVSEVLLGKRGLSLEQIARLHHGLGIPLACLVPMTPVRGSERTSVRSRPGTSSASTRSNGRRATSTKRPSKTAR